MTGSKGGIKGAIEGMEPGQSRAGFLPGGNITRLPDYIPPREELSPEDSERKGVIRNLLLKWIEPNELSSRSNKSLDLKSWAGKLNRMTLVEMLRLLPDWFGDVPIEKLNEYLNDTESLLEGDKAEIQERYKDISP